MKENESTLDSRTQRRTDLGAMWPAKFAEIFPTKWSAVIFVLYMTLFISQGLLVTNTQKSHSYDYDPSVAVLATETIKFAVCVLWYCGKYNCFALFDQTWKNVKLLWLYFVPAILYCYYNNLSYINLLHFDPPTYSILLQLRVVITGFLFQILFKRSLTFIQWSSLISLTIGCMMKNMDFDFVVRTLDDSSTTESAALFNDTTVVRMKHIESAGFGFNVYTGLIVVQVLCSCFAGVYTEFLLKNKGAHVEVAIQNVFLYADSIMCNALILLWKSNFFDVSSKSLSEVMDTKVLIVIVNNAAVGIVTSFFLRYLNSILKTVASALELIFIAILTWIFFGVAITWQTAMSIAIVSFSIILYTRNPVQNPPIAQPCKAYNHV